NYRCRILGRPLQSRPAAGPPRVTSFGRPGSLRVTASSKSLRRRRSRRHDLPSTGDLREESMAGNKHWVGTWAAAPAPAEGVVGFNNHTLRMNPRISIGGDRLRVRISNAYGSRPLPIGTARIALRDNGAATVPGSDCKLTFGGSD